MFAYEGISKAGTDLKMVPLFGFGVSWKHINQVFNADTVSPITTRTRINTTGKGCMVHMDFEVAEAVKHNRKSKMRL